MQSMQPAAHETHDRLVLIKNPFKQLVHCLLLVNEHDLQFGPVSHRKHSPCLKLYPEGHVLQVLLELQVKSGTQDDPLSL
jgi:hypothetical protein